jgi:hypothetical protein
VRARAAVCSRDVRNVFILGGIASAIAANHAGGLRQVCTCPAGRILT